MAAARWIAVLCVGVALPGVVNAQTNERVYEQLDFRFVTPGARAVGMGKTFVGLADDATAAASNPAGLSNLLEQELSFELSHTNYRHLRYTGGGVNPTTDVFAQTVFVPSFFSYVAPVRDATFSFYRQTLQKFRDEFLYDGRDIPLQGRELGEDGAYGNMAIDVVNYGIGVSYVFNRYVAAGGTACITHVDLTSEAWSGYIGSSRNKGTTTDDSGTTWTAVAGVLVKPIRRLAIGATYYGRASVTMETTFFGRFAWETPEYERENPRYTRDLTGARAALEYVLPSRLAVGASWRPVDRLVLAADVQRVNYSERVTDKFLIVDFQNPKDRLRPRNFYFDDVTELHVGGEYRVVTHRSVLGFRLGLFTDPDHFLRFRPDGMNTEGQNADEFLHFRFNRVRPGTEVGVTGGMGFTLANRFQADFAVSRSGDVNEIVISMVTRLK